MQVSIKQVNRHLRIALIIVYFLNVNSDMNKKTFKNKKEAQIVRDLLVLFKKCIIATNSILLKSDITHNSAHSHNAV